MRHSVEERGSEVTEEMAQLPPTQSQCSCVRQLEFIREGTRGGETGSQGRRNQHTRQRRCSGGTDCGNERVSTFSTTQVHGQRAMPPAGQAWADLPPAFVHPGAKSVF